METFGLILIVLHVIGTIIGVGGATMIEVHIGQVLKDKLVSDDERSILAIDYQMVRIGLIIVLLSGFGFLLLDKFEGTTQYLYSPRLWAKMLMVVLIAANTLLLQAHAINLYWGSALSFVSWWTAAFIGMFITHQFKFDFYDGFFPGHPFSTVFTSYMTLFVVALVIGAVVLHYFRNKNVASHV